MGFRFHKSIKILPGVRLNFNKKSFSITAGGKLGGVTINSRTGASARVSVPGAGISYRTKTTSSASKPKPKVRKVYYLDYEPDYIPDDYLDNFDLPYDLPDNPPSVGCAGAERYKHNKRRKR